MKEHDKIDKDKQLFIDTLKIKCLNPVLIEWNEVLLRYLKKTQYSDCQWEYNERAILSSFAAAVWLNDDIALEEYSSERKGKHGRKYSGRCDLYFKTGKHDFNCEAKKITCGIGGKSKKSNTIDLVKSGLKEAYHEAKRKIPKDAGRRLGMCFVVPRLPKAEIKNKDKPITDFQENIKNNKEKIGYSSIAMIFPEKTRKQDKEEKHHYPGVALLIKEV